MFTADARSRLNNNVKTTFTFAEPQKLQKWDFQGQDNRGKQFTDTPLQPGATRQSYQDSDIFGTKQGSETVQKSAYNTKNVKTRQQNTFASSNVLGVQADAEQSKPVLNKNYGQIARKEEKWSSHVFGDAQINPATRKPLNHNDKGREGLFGDNAPKDAMERRVPFAASISQKQQGWEPKHND